MDRISNKDFHKWLKEGTAPLRCEGNGYHHAFIRFPKNDDFVYVFAQSAYHGTDVIRNDVFDFCGLYYIPEELMYCESLFLKKCTIHPMTSFHTTNAG